MIKPKPSSDSAAEFTHMVLPSDTNAKGTIFGGRVMEWIDLASAIVADRHCRMTPVTVSIDALHFILPIKLGYIVILKAAINFTHRTSMEIGVTIEAENPKTGVRALAANAFLTFVAVDENDRPTEIPPLLCTTAEEKKRFEEGKRRRENRLRQNF